MYHDWVSLKINDLLGQFFPQKKKFTTCPKHRISVFFIEKKTFLGMYTTAIIKALHLLMIFRFYFIVHDYISLWEDVGTK